MASEISLDLQNLLRGLLQPAERPPFDVGPDACADPGDHDMGVLSLRHGCHLDQHHGPPYGCSMT